MLRTKLFQAFAGLVLIIGLLAAFFVHRIIQNRVIGEAQQQVSLDMGSARALFDNKLKEVSTILDLVAVKKAVVDAASDNLWASEDLQQRLGVIQRNFGLDFLSVVSPEGQVVLRTARPHHTGDFRLQDPAVAQALRGQSVIGLEVLSRSELLREGEQLAEKAFFSLEPTPRARATHKTEEDRGMVILGAVPIFKGPQLLGVLYGGVLLNRHHDLVDHISEVVFKNETYNGSPIGTATLFLGDCRIATTVRLPNGNRALGTRASKDVADRVLDNGTPWINPAYVVRDRYLSAYEPLRDLENHVIGMLYVGRLEQPFLDLSRQVMRQYIGLMVFGLAAALILAFFMASRLAFPIHQLVEESKRIRAGARHVPVAERSSCHEIENLVVAFNEMAATREDREAKLRALNESYMSMLGFVSHELKSPVASILNYAFLLKQQKVGSLTPSQEKAVRNIETNSKRIVEMVRHYLNLSRIESAELHPVLSRVEVLEDVVRPLLETADPDLQARKMRVELHMTEDQAVRADLNQVREVFENLISNGIKYGRDGGLLTLGAEPQGNWTRFWVRNEGPGITPDKYETIFQKFVRIEDDPHARRQRGTGLGLFITRHIIEAHGGRIEVESVPQEWVEFRFTLPTWQGEK